MKVRLSVKHKTAESPGIFDDSTLKFYLKAEKHEVEKVEAAIKKALRETTNA